MSMGSMQQLSARLAQKRAESAARFETQTRQRLKEHDDALKKLSSDALSETQGAIESESQSLQKSLKAHRSAVRRLTKELQEIHQAEAKRLRWVMRVPLVCVTLITALMAGGIWGWWKYQKPWDLVLMRNGQMYQVLKGDWTAICSVSRQKRPCRPAPGGSRHGNQ